MVKGGETTMGCVERERKELGAALRERRVGWVLTAN